MDTIEQKARAGDVPPFLIDLWHTVVYWFMLPGQRMIESLSQTPWGKDWGVPAEPHWSIVVFVALVFWCILLSILSAASAQVSGFLHRNARKRPVA